MKKIISLCLAVFMLLNITAGMRFSVYAADYTNTSAAVKANTLTTGDKFQMGMYPQTRVEDEETVKALAAIDCTMKDYDYMQNAEAGTHTYDKVDMKYADIFYDGLCYRKVIINEYRPYYIFGNINNSGTFQDDNDYTVGNTYYFKWEPIIWQVLAKEADGVYVMSQSLLDAQAYHNYWESATWETSSLRTWLNEDFYNAAFSAKEQEKIVTTTLENEKIQHNSSVSGGNDTTDNVWILSYSDAVNSAYGFNADAKAGDTARQAKGSDYAKAQGLFAYYTNGCSYWWLRSLRDYAEYACDVSVDGFADDFSMLYRTDYGVRPAFKLNLTSDIFKSDAAQCRIEGHTWDAGSVTTAPTCITAGEKIFSCTICNEKKPEEIAFDENAHDYGEPTYQWKQENGEWKCTAQRVCANDTNHIDTETVIGFGAVKTAATCTEAGTTTYTALFFNSVFAMQTKEENDILPLGHDYQAAVTAPTCTEQGYTTYTCLRCGDEYKDDYVDALNHDYQGVVTAPTCTEQGYTTYACTRCDDTYKADYVNAAGHTYGREGNARFTCTVCGFINESLKAAAEKADKEAAEKAAAEKAAREAEEAAKQAAAEKAEQEKAAAEFVAGVQGVASKNKVTVKWGKVKGADRYVIYATYCDKNHKTKYKKIKTVKGNVTKYAFSKLNGKKLNPKKNVKVYVVAQKKNGKKYKTLFKTPTFHIAGAQSKNTNVKKIKVKKSQFTLAVGKTAKIKPTLVLNDKAKKPIEHVAKYRYQSSNTAVVKVSKKGKIKAVGKGKAVVYVYSNNGAAKAITVTVE